MRSEEGEQSEVQTTVHELAPAAKSAGWVRSPGPTRQLPPLPLASCCPMTASRVLQSCRHPWWFLGSCGCTSRLWAPRGSRLLHLCVLHVAFALPLVPLCCSLPSSHTHAWTHLFYRSSPTYRWGQPVSQTCHHVPDLYVYSHHP